MKRAKKRVNPNPPPRRGSYLPWGTPVWVCLAAFLGILYLYSPALNGQFIYDDLSLPFSVNTWNWFLSSWIAGRPVLMFSYWLNHRFSGTDPFSYHLVNVAIHCVNTGLVFLILYRLLMMAGWPQQRTRFAAIAGALVFAIHPLQTESVSYVAGRSESLASLFLLLAYAVFLYCGKEPASPMSWWQALLVLFLFGLGMRTKENAVSLAGILILTDLSWPAPFSIRGLRRSWRLYCLMVPGAIAAAVVVVRSLSASKSAGFSAASLKWYQYGFTEARAIFTYIRMAILPFGQSIDQDYARSHTIMEHGAIYCIIVLAALFVAAIIWRRRYPLSCFGFLMFLIWLAPTSSIIPIADPLVERRMYLPLLGLILIGCDVGSRMRVSRTAAVGMLALLCLVFGKLCYDRNRLWGEPVKLVEMAADSSEYNPRPLIDYADILIQEKRCDLAPPYLERAERLVPHSYFVNATWGRALACLGQYDQAVTKLQAAAQIQPSAKTYELIGLIYSETGRLEQAGEELKHAVELNPDYESAHRSLGLWYERVNNFAAAEQEYRAALSLNHDDLNAQRHLVQVHAMMTQHATP